MGSSTSSSSAAVPRRFHIRWYHYLPFIGYHHVLMFLLAVSIALQSVLVAGCTSENLSNIYLFSLSYSNQASPHNPSPLEVNTNASKVISSLVANETTLQVRAGYLGMCLSTGMGWICSGSSGQLASVIQHFESDGKDDPMNLIYAADKFKTEVIFVGLLFISIPFALIAIVLLGTFPGWHDDTSSEGSEREVKPFPSRPVSHVALGSVTVAALMAFISSFWQHMGSVAASTMAETFTYGEAVGNVGAGAMVLGWLSFFLQTVACLGLVVMILSIKYLASLSS